ncbi:uncharacterized protein [Temnothorax longispinosus]|uniref:uncharacterized protein n=1 Tax=Temnothorax longispinosus TaxID=300112 RepID=UPI003A999621
MDADLRTDESFNTRQNPQHHTNNVSPLETIGTGMVSQFRLDSMHLKDQGAFKRWLKFLLVGPGNFTLTDATLRAVSNALVELTPHTPREFNRKPRQLKRSGNRLKAQELRRIALYDGVKIFKNYLTPVLYQNFLLFHTSIYILSSPHLLDRCIDVAEELMREFVTHSIQIFGREFAVYNIHSLIHLAEECRQHGVLDNFSAYKFENHLGLIKRSLRCPYQPLQQIANRDSEGYGNLRKTTNKILDRQEILLSKRREGQAEIPGDHYSKIKTRNITLAVNEADCCFVTNQNDVVVLTNIIRTPQREIRLAGHRFTRMTSYYEFPIDSTDIGILSVSELSEREQFFRLSDVAHKCYLIPDENIYLCIPLAHTLF